MKIKFLSAFLALVMAFSSFSAFADDDVEDIIPKTEAPEISDITQNRDSGLESDELITLESEQEIQNMLSSMLVGYVGHSGVLLKGNKLTESIGPLLKNDEGYYFPVRAVAAYMDGRCEWRPDTQAVHIRYGNLTVQIFVGKNEYYVNGIAYTAPKAVLKNGDYVYLHTDSIQQIFDKNVYTNENLVIVLDDKISFNVETENTLQFKLLAELVFERPDKERIWSDFCRNVSEKEHPRVVINQERIDTVLEKAKTNEQYKLWIERIVNTAEGIITTPVTKYAMQSNGQILGLARTLMNRFRTLGLAYLLTRDQRFADRAWLEIQEVATYPSWNEIHFLDVAEISAAFAYAYDWMYDGFTEEQRALMRKLAMVNSIEHALISYRGTGPKMPSTRYGWPNSANNWNPVCNGGVAMLCTAMLDEPDIRDAALECLESGLRSLENNMEQFYPNGVYYESNGYFLYNMEYLAPYLSTLDTAFGTNYGFINSPGLMDSFYCRMYYDGPVGMFSYGDGDDSKIDMPTWAYFAKAANDPVLMKRRKDILKSGGGSISEILWYDEDFANFASDDALSLDASFDGLAQVGFFRNSWDDFNGLYLAARAGYGALAHSHIDVGSFYINALGKSWTYDSGAGDYTWPEYFGVGRYNYYKLRAEGHNMIVMNPDETGGYDMTSTTDIVSMVSKGKGGYMVLDMTDGYKPYGATSATRAMGLIDDRTRFVVQDEIEADKESEFYWFMHTGADIEISDDGKSAILSLDNCRMLCELISDGGTFSVMDSVSFETSPVYAPQTYPDSRKLTVHIENAKSADISVIMTPYMDGEPVPYYAGEFKKISEWKIPDGEIPKLSSMELDGEPYIEFDSNKSMYNIGYYEEKEQAPVITASSDNYDVSIEQAASVPGEAKIHLMQNDEIIKTIKVNFTLKDIIGQIPGKQKYVPVYADASDIPEAANGPMNLIDNIITTKWAAQGQQHAILDLGELKKVDTVSVAWLSPASRITPLNIYVSEDQKEWKLVYSGKSRGIDTEFESYGFDEQQARYVKLEVFGNNATVWNSIFEVGIYGNSK